MSSGSVSSVAPLLLSVIFAFAYTCSRISPIDGARILAVETVSGKSHWNVMSSMLRVLTENGHNVTVFTPFPDGDRDNYTEVDLSREFPMKLEMDVIDTIRSWAHPDDMFRHIRTNGRVFCDISFENDRMAGILQKDGRPDFDLVVIETLGNDCVSYLATKLDLPVIYLITSPMITFTERHVYGHVSNPATVSNLYADHAVPKTFGQRLYNTVLLAYMSVVLKYDEFVNRYINRPKPYDLITSPVQPSVVFLNSHFVSEAPRPFPPNVIQIGGIHLKPVKSIPNDIIEFIENSPHGVILFTFGSTMRISTLPKNILNAFKEALAQLPQRVLWKYEGKMENLPKNVMIRKWFPQRDILVHPNVKLFICHGGMSGVYETVDAGVPVLGFPLFYDQPKNIDNLVRAGMAISMDLLSVKKETFLMNVRELLTNENYTKNAKAVSSQFRDRPISSQQSVLYWTEYVIRHNGASHLKSHAFNLKWYEYFLLDVLTAISIFILIISYALRKFYTTVRETFKPIKTKHD